MPICMSWRQVAHTRLHQGSKIEIRGPKIGPKKKSSIIIWPILYIHTSPCVVHTNVVRVYIHMYVYTCTYHIHSNICRRSMFICPTKPFVNLGSPHLSSSQPWRVHLWRHCQCRGSWRIANFRLTGFACMYVHIWSFICMYVCMYVCMYYLLPSR